jgi:hypothetical protein
VRTGGWNWLTIMSTDRPYFLCWMSGFPYHNVNFS